MAFRKRRLFAAQRSTVAAALLCFCSLAQADDQSTLIIQDNAGSTIASYTKEQLEQRFSVREIKTATPWALNGESAQYRGSALKEIISIFDIQGAGRVEVSAHDGFVSEIRLSDIEQYNPIIAFEISCSDTDRTDKRCEPNQEFRSLAMQDRGELQIIWPMGELPESYIPAHNGIWVWYVKSLRPAN